MKFLPTIKIWKTETLEQIKIGALKIQTGQWIQCNPDDRHLSRFVRVTGQTIWLTHWQGSSSESNKKFLDTVGLLKLALSR